VDPFTGKALEIGGNGVKNDLSYVAILVGFFLLSILFVVACEKIIGPDEAALAEGTAGAAEAGEADEAAS
jgi:hypothetical protein